ncbi:hypothetical protein N7471_012039 [Penicillium samsonianum]|uniref:uncharacterized protein n=1 Tax=Penicillium samsonianum TaxID=1882272 RepID=UPI0025482641|nr:uncharacterized protein N7471_012039 [Penicillium samsonianum]KAJ6124722.1 hypothetical protein N7471_012039 [Penicillium samsonianum]
MATVLSKCIPKTNSQPTELFTVFQFISVAYCVGSTDSITNNPFLRNIPKRGGKVPRPGEEGRKDDQGNIVPIA